MRTNNLMITKDCSGQMRKRISESVNWGNDQQNSIINLPKNCEKLSGFNVARNILKEFIIQENKIQDNVPTIVFFDLGTDGLDKVLISLCSLSWCQVV